MVAAIPLYELSAKPFILMTWGREREREPKLYVYGLWIEAATTIASSSPVCLPFVDTHLFSKLFGFFKVSIIRIFSFSFVNLCNIASYLCQWIFKLPMSTHVEDCLRYGLIIIIVYWLFIFPSTKVSLFECFQTFTHA